MYRRTATEATTSPSMRSSLLRPTLMMDQHLNEAGVAVKSKFAVNNLVNRKMLLIKNKILKKYRVEKKILKILSRQNIIVYKSENVLQADLM
jgi:hypothetical protein